VDATHDTLLVAGNAGAEPATTALTLVYNGGKSRYTMEKLLQPGEQLWADVGSLIGNQTPDKDGQVIPPGTAAGSYEVRDVDDPVRGKVYEGKLILDKTFGHAAYGCGVCCGYRWAIVDPGPYEDAVGSGTADILWAANSCSADNVDVTGDGYNWGSNNTSVASVAGAYTSLVGAGSATGSAFVDLPNTSIRQNCPYVTYYPTQAISAFSASLSSSPSPVTRGSTVTCTAATQVPSGTSPVFSNWKFSDGTNTVNGSGASSLRSRSDKMLVAIPSPDC
jgi:hypothetical protein